MNYYYDILVNLNDYLYEFYEWEKSDNIIAIKKTPVIKVKSQTIIDFLTKNIILDEKVATELMGKTICKNNIEKIDAFLITDCKTALFVEFNQEGKIIYRSKLLIEDENNLNEVATSLKKTEIKYQTKEELKLTKETRQTLKEKREIKAELSLKYSKNKDKCDYLYYELFHKNSEDYDLALEEMQDGLDKLPASKIHHFAHLINLTKEESL